jgi:hypothetical protein
MMAAKIAMGVLFLVSCVLFYLGWVNKWSLAHLLIIFDHLFIMIGFGMMVAAFGFGFFWMMVKADSSKPALILENDGYIDNVGLLKGHKFLYNDIDRFEDKTISMNRCILVHFKDVDAFLDAQTGIKKKLMKGSYKQTGSPVSIPARSFDYKFEDLLAELNTRLGTSR